MGRSNSFPDRNNPYIDLIGTERMDAKDFIRTESYSLRLKPSGANTPIYRSTTDSITNNSIRGS